MIIQCYYMINQTVKLFLNSIKKLDIKLNLKNQSAFKYKTIIQKKIVIKKNTNNFTKGE